MSARAVTVTGFVLLFALAAGLVVLSRLRPGLVARFGQALDAVWRQHVLVRGLLIFCWAWLGWHFLARNG